MDGGTSIPPRQTHRGWRFLAVGVCSLLAVAPSRASADDPPSLVTLARRYYSPARLFEPTENDIDVDRVVVPQNMFRIPPEAPPPIQFSVGEPPAFVTASDAVAPRRVAPPAPAVSSAVVAAPAAAVVQTAADPSIKFSAGEPPAFVKASAAVAPSHVAAPVAPRAPAVPSARAAVPAGAVVRAAVDPSIKFSAGEPPAFVKASAAVAPSHAAAPVAAPAPVVSSTRVAAPAAAGVQAAADPPIRFSTGEPPAFFTMNAGAAPSRVSPPAPAVTSTRVATPVAPVVVPAPAQSPVFVVPSPPELVASQIPDTPAFSSTADPLNIRIISADQPTPPPAPGADSSAAAQSGAPGSFGEVEKLGDAPPSNTLEFLRQQAILLKPGQCQFDWGLSYSVYDERAALPVVNGSGTVVGVANERERLQLMTIPFAVRYGLCEGLQAYVNAPLGWSNTETTTDNGGSLTNNFVGLGDISAGFNYQIMKGCGAYKPDVIVSLGFIAPTGHATFATSLLAPNSALGQGFWDITTQILAVHTIDPVIFYYGAGYVHRFDASFGDNLQVDPGQEFDYLFGVGFAVNPWVTISGTLIGNYLTRYGVNDVSIPGSDLDLMRFRISVTIVRDKRICEPFAEIGMTPDSPSRVGVTFTY